MGEAVRGNFNVEVPPIEVLVSADTCLVPLAIDSLAPELGGVSTFAMELDISASSTDARF